MKIILNGDPTETSAQTLSALLLEINLTDAAVATAVDEEFVPASAREAFILSEGQRIEVLAPMQGG
ncbi:MAG: sulfur carrier protein ThiS [Pseudoruegeria sp.]